MSPAAAGIFRLALRRHFRRTHPVALGIMLAVLALILLEFLRGGDSAERYLPFTVGFYSTFLVPLLAFISGGGAWRDEMKPEAADYFLLRGVSKFRYLIFRYAAHVVCAELDFAPAVALVIVSGAMAHVPHLAAAAPVMILGQVLAVAAYAAFGFLCAALTSRWVIVGLVYGSVVEIGLGNVPLAINQFAVSHPLRILLHSVSHNSDPSAFALSGERWMAAAGLVLFAAGFTVAAALRFRLQEQLGEKAE
ncbi:MAG TPA: hypothetical protein VGL42_16550 [Opitutaceae bacterium]|jgi:ABC-type transport system involved in multi-copper enzyme maturation permease subunit